MGRQTSWSVLPSACRALGLFRGEDELSRRLWEESSGETRWYANQLACLRKTWPTDDQVIAEWKDWLARLEKPCVYAGQWKSAQGKFLRFAKQLQAEKANAEKQVKVPGPKGFVSIAITSLQRGHSTKVYRRPVSSSTCHSLALNKIMAVDRAAALRESFLAVGDGLFCHTQ